MAPEQVRQHVVTFIPQVRKLIMKTFPFIYFIERGDRYNNKVYTLKVLVLTLVFVNSTLIDAMHPSSLYLLSVHQRSSRSIVTIITCSLL